MSKLKLILPALIITFLLSIPTSASAVNSKSLVNRLKVKNEISNKGYNRDAFPHWITQKDGCTTRQTVLIKEKLEGDVSNCVVNNGAWYSEYEGKTFHDPGQLDIDHFVPLAQAYRSGAYRWDVKTRTAYANDLGYEWNLIAVSASTNRSKSDQDPATWLPSLKEFQCRYVAAWVAVKYRWSLTIDKSEKKAIQKVFSKCSTKQATVRTPSRARIKIDKNTATPDNGTTTPPPSTDGNDPKFTSCAKAKAAGYGPYTKGSDPEYAWYRDADNDGIVCE